jgi:hypothetical protein
MPLQAAQNRRSVVRLRQVARRRPPRQICRSAREKGGGATLAANAGAGITCSLRGYRYPRRKLYHCSSRTVDASGEPLGPSPLTAIAARASESRVREGLTVEVVQLAQNHDGSTSGELPRPNGRSSARDQAIKQLERKRKFHAEAIGWTIVMVVLVVIWAMSE